MGRVTRPGGAVAVQAFNLREEQPAYGPWIAMVTRHAGKDALRMLGTYWVLGDRDLMRNRCASAGLRVNAVHDYERPAHFPSVEAMVLTEVNATPLADRLSQSELDAIIADSYTVYEPFPHDGRGAADHSADRLRAGRNTRVSTSVRCCAMTRSSAARSPGRCWTRSRSTDVPPSSPRSSGWPTAPASTCSRSTRTTRWSRGSCCGEFLDADAVAALGPAAAVEAITQALRGGLDPRRTRHGCRST